MTITFGPHAREDDLTPHSRLVLTDLMAATDEASVTISSTRRTPAEQARVMYENVVAHGGLAGGIDFNLRLYGPFGDQVIRVCEDGMRRGRKAMDVQSAMAAKILAIGPYHVSHHAADPRVDGINVFDIAPSSLRNQKAFVRAATADTRVSKVIAPPADPGVHLEIPQPVSTNEA